MHTKRKTTKKQPKNQEHHTRDTVLSAAKLVFGEFGFDAASMSAIAQKAGIEKSSLYYFFKSKEDLFSAVTVAMWYSLHNSVIKNIENDRASEGRQVLSRMCQGFIDISTGAGMSMTRMELPKVKSSAYNEIIETIRHMRLQTISFLKRHKVANAGTAHSLISNAIHAYVIHCRTGKPQPPPKQYCDYLSSLIIAKNN